MAAHACLQRVHPTATIPYEYVKMFTTMVEGKQRQEELNDEQLDEVNGGTGPGDFGDLGKPETEAGLQFDLQVR